MQWRITREALIAELKNAEAILSTVIWRFAMGAQDPREGVKELKWCVREGREGSVLIDEPSPEMLQIAARTDEELIERFRHYTPSRHPGLALSLPAVDAVLSNPPLTLSGEQFLRLNAVKWQSQLLAAGVADIREWLRLTFTIEDEENHALVEENYSKARTSYSSQAKYALDAVRQALKVLGRKNPPGNFG
jgi:hypothetical protein